MESAFNEFNNIYSMIDNLYHEAALRLGLTDSELDILYVLNAYSGSCNQSALYKESGQTRSTINSAVKKMEKAGYLTISAGTGRNTRVTLTPSGQTLMEQTLYRVIRIENEIYESWSAEDRQTFMRLNKDFADKLKERVRQL